jgi:glycosyltransferase involved in cell wall biosynthesis
MVRPGLIISARDYINLLMLAGRKAAGLSSDAKLIWTYHTHTSSELRHAPRLFDRIVAALGDRLIQQADARIAVSTGVAQDLERRLGLAPGQVGVIGNPIWTKSRLALRNAPCPHPWLSSRQPGERSADSPVILGVGRLTAQKDFANLLDSFALLHRRKPSSRLIILGEGDDRAELVARAERLGVASKVSMPGHVPDPLPYLSRADLFVLSSRWEGFSVALVEALGAGCPVVSTDCPSGPSEILEGGRIAPLVPPGNSSALASAMELTLSDPGALEQRLAAGLRYDAQRAARQYLEAVALHD